MLRHVALGLKLRLMYSAHRVISRLLRLLYRANDSLQQYPDLKSGCLKDPA